MTDGKGVCSLMGWYECLNEVSYEGRIRALRFDTTQVLQAKADDKFYVRNLYKMPL